MSSIRAAAEHGHPCHVNFNFRRVNWRDYGVLTGMIGINATNLLTFRVFTHAQYTAQKMDLPDSNFFLLVTISFGI